ncbi:hypothetical protein NEP96_05090 [Escherichia coli]|uniref:Uncharacterized protein n=2 Tax=Asteriusvirus PBECO4 TaxID=2560463 RepID=A0A1C3S6X4_9CAUD|nr:hypothetical protein [Escherichia phage UB]MDI0694804.1 hypothetical protein [Escherichia coli]MED6572855.1 hypothetical protein [Escherichia coli O157]SCA80364.1 hypothetical protein PSLUR01_00387 [Escherichia phage vB_Eco_slurp01]MDI1114090.1 hypothetical protein [Escherichia coli]
MKITRFGKTFELNIVSVYKKGKSGKLSTDNIRFVISDYYDMFNQAFEENKFGLILCKPQKPELGILDLRTDKSDFIGNLDIIEFKVDISKEHFRIKNYNYYKVDINSIEVQNVLDELISNNSCFTK